MASVAAIKNAALVTPRIRRASSYADPPRLTASDRAGRSALGRQHQTPRSPPHNGGSAPKPPLKAVMHSYVPLLLLFVVAAIITVALFTLAAKLGPKNPTAEKMIPYECGSESTGGRFVKPSVKF